VRETGDLLAWRSASFSYQDDVGRLPLALKLLGLTTAGVCLYLVFRPLAAPRNLPDPALRRAAVELVRAHGADTLAFFKLREDEHYLFTPDRRAFLGYRVDSGVMLVSGDPIGPEDALPALVEEAIAFAERRSLKLAALGVGAAGRDLWRQAGLRSLYLGDEAIVETAGFSLEGRAIRKIRQSVNRLEKAGYSASLERLSTLDAETLRRLESISRAWRRGGPERGFAMAMDSLRGEHQQETSILLARDGDGVIRGFLHFVPSYGRAAVSLSFMRREHDTPNGLTEFMVVRALELLRDRGIAEVSLNFATFARWLHSPSGRLERLLGRLIALANPFFQIESLYRFNAKFFPRWEPRYFLYESMLGLPRAGLAALFVEGHLPKPSPRRLAALALARAKRREQAASLEPPAGRRL
jgi:lysyl-tRNA synthetase class 2